MGNLILKFRTFGLGDRIASASGLRYRCLAAFMTIALGACMTTKSGAQDVGGAYDLAGQVGAAAYDGGVTITPRGQSFLMDWQRKSPGNSRGFALRLGDVLGVAVEDEDDDFGIVLYRVNKGHLAGIWNGYYNTRGPLGRENLDGAANLEGTFRISLGSRPDRGQYGGHVEIKHAGQTYLVDWYAPSAHYIGIGVLMGDIFVVGYASKHRPGVAAYCVNSAIYTGVTAAGEDSALGAEILWAHGKPAPEGLDAQLAALRKKGTAVVCSSPVVENSKTDPQNLQLGLATP